MMQADRFASRAANAAFAIAFAMIVSGCAAKGCPTCPKPPPTIPGLNVGMCNSDLSTILNVDLSSPTDAPEVLLLSAGGSWGAWGAGILYDWLETTKVPPATSPPPKFEVVVGASTGALLGTFALIGDKTIVTPSGPVDMLEKLKEVYTKVNDPDVYKRRLLLAMPFSNSINTLDPLRELAEKTFTHEVIDAVGAIYTTEKRQLWVGTTNLDSGEYCNWNLTAIAAAKQYDRYIDLLIASSANPGIFDPVYIPRNANRENQDLHADGGVRHQLFARVFSETVAAYDQAWSTLATKPSDKPITYAIANGQLSVRRMCVEDHVLPIMLRALAILQTSALDGDLHRVQDVGNGGVPGWETQTAFIPADFPLWPSPDKFVDADMKTLFELAVAKSKSGTLWYAGVPNFPGSSAPCLEGTFPMK